MKVISDDVSSIVDKAHESELLSSKQVKEDKIYVSSIDYSPTTGLLAISNGNEDPGVKLVFIADLLRLESKRQVR